MRCQGLCGMQQPRALTHRPHVRVAAPMLRPSVCRPAGRQLRVDTRALIKGFGKVDTTKNRCPCGSGVDYSECCQKLHKVQQMKAAGPEQLLKARFSAYVKKDWKYIVRTTHTSNEARQGSTSADGKIKTTFEQDVKVTMTWAELSKLEILKVRTGPSPEQAEVDFQYAMKQMFELQTGQKIKDPPSKVITETALFEVEEGDWRVIGSNTNWDRNTLQATA